MAMFRLFATPLPCKIFLIVIFVAIQSANTSGQGFKLYDAAYRSKFLKYDRGIYVYTPPIVLKRTKRYPVLYFHDGQNLYDPKRSVFGTTWQLEKILNFLITRKIIPPIFVVGIDNSPDRIFEYTFIRDLQGQGGGAKNYLDFIVQELIPDMEKKFPISSDRGLVGSSLGGLVSLYAAITHPQTFNRIAALSPSIWWEQRKILRYFTTATVLPAVLYADSGTDGGERPQDVMELDKIIQKYFKDKILFKKVISQGATHDEASWAKRLPEVLQFLFSN